MVSNRVVPEHELNTVGKWSGSAREGGWYRPAGDQNGSMKNEWKKNGEECEDRSLRRWSLDREYTPPPPPPPPPFNFRASEYHTRKHNFNVGGVCWVVSKHMRERGR